MMFVTSPAQSWVLPGIRQRLPVQEAVRRLGYPNGFEDKSPARS